MRSLTALRSLGALVFVLLLFLAMKPAFDQTSIAARAVETSTAQRRAPSDPIGSYLRAHPQQSLIAMLLCLAGGLTIALVGWRAQFNRTNVAGVEVYRSFSRMLVSRFVRGVLKIVGAILIIVALLMFFALAGAG